MKRRFWQGILSAVGIMILILDPQTALDGAVTGIKLCLWSVVPSLLPFFVLSALLTDSLESTLLRPLGRLCGIPQGGEGILVAGLLGGYPVGAQAIGRAYRAGQLDEKTSRRMLMFCSNAGPAFIFGIVASKFDQVWAGFALWLIHIASAVLVGALLPGKTDGKMRMEKASLSLTEAVSSSVKVLAVVCGWIVLMRVVMAFLEKWFLQNLSDALGVIVMGALELANGCCALENIGDPGVRFVTASALLSFGGLCVAMQTASVTGTLGIRDYLRGKLMQTVISIALSLLFVPLFDGGASLGRMAAISVFLVILGILAGNLKNKCSNPGTIGV